MAQAVLSCGPALPADSCPVPGIRHSDRQAYSGDGKPYPGHPFTGASWGHVMQMQIDPQQTPDIGAVKETAWRWAYIAGLGGLFGMLWHMADAFKERTWTQRLIALLCSTCAGAAAGPTAIILATAVAAYFGFALSLDTKLAIGCVFAGMGSKFLDIGITFLKGWSKANLAKPEDIEECRRTMTPEQRARHADTCVFTPDRCKGRCLQCPHRKDHLEE